MTEIVVPKTDISNSVDPIQAADSLLREQRLTIPTDVYKLAKDLKYSVYEVGEEIFPHEKYKNFESLSIFNKPNDREGQTEIPTYSIFINKVLNPLKKRFVLAREIGSIKMEFIAPGNTIIIRWADFDASDRSRKQCEEFAFELLMPKDEVLKLYNQLATPYLEPFIDHFKLSVITIQDRLKQLGLRYL